MIRKRMLAGICGVIVACGLCGCAGGSDSSVQDSQGAGAGSSVSDISQTEGEGSSEPEKMPDTYEEYYELMKEKSLYSLGYVNTMKDVIERAQSGEDVTVAYIGGSITEGYTVSSSKCYAYLTAQYFADTYGTGENVHYVNAGLSGTPSILGAFRLERDVLSHDPDVVFIEFAVNDGTDASYQSAYEGLIRTIHERNPETAIVLLFARTEDGYSAQDVMKPIGEYYSLPMISYADGITYMIDNGQLEWKKFSNDSSHPNVNGHAMVSDMIEYYYEQVTAADRSEEDYLYPMLYLLSDSYVDCHIVEGDTLSAESLGSWTEGSSINTFMNGWTFDGDADNNEPIIFKVTGKSLYLLFKENAVGSGMGTVKVTITSEDGTVEEIAVSAETSGGWGDPTVSLIKMGGIAQEFTVSISMEEGFEDKEFQILGFGYRS